MKFFKFEEDTFILESGNRGLVMNREEVEVLFVRIGHVLQDDDVQKEEDDNN